MLGKKFHRSYSMGQGWGNLSVSEEYDPKPKNTSILNKQSCSSENGKFA
jgi:hypothetical protein